MRSATVYTAEYVRSFTMYKTKELTWIQHPDSPAPSRMTTQLGPVHSSHSCAAFTRPLHNKPPREVEIGGQAVLCSCGISNSFMLSTVPTEKPYFQSTIPVKFTGMASLLIFITVKSPNCFNDCLQAFSNSHNCQLTIPLTLIFPGLNS